MVAANVDVEILNQNQITTFKNPTTLRVQGLTRDTQTHTFVRLGWISSVTAPDQSINVSAFVDSTRINLTVRATFEELVRKAVRTDNAELSLYLMNLAAPHIKKQYDDLSGFNDQYAERRADILLVRMRKVYDSLTEGERTKLRVHGQLIRNIFGGKPIRFLNPKRDEWDAAQAMISEMGLPGAEPKDVNQQQMQLPTNYDRG